MWDGWHPKTVRAPLDLLVYKSAKLEVVVVVVCRFRLRESEERPRIPMARRVA